MKKLILYVVMAISLNSCTDESHKHFFQSFETTIKVMDADKSPVKGRKVKCFIRPTSPEPFFTSSQPRFAQVTDSEGKTVFSYSLENASDFTEVASFVIEEDSIWKNVVYPYHLAEGVTNKGVKKQELILLIDSLSPIKVRLKKTSTSPLLLSLSSLSALNYEFEIKYSDQNARSNFNWPAHFSWSRREVGVFDSLFVFKMFTKVNNRLTARTDTSLVSSTGTSFFEKKEVREIELRQRSFRDSTIQFSLK